MSLVSARLSARLWVTAIVMVVVFGASLVLTYRLGSVEIRPLHQPLAELPFSIGGLQGQDRELDPIVARRVGAVETISRVYAEAASARDISMHVAVFTALNEPTLPHPPAACYRLSGAEVLETRAVTVPAKTPFTAQLMTTERNGVKSYVMFWYCWDKYVCTTRSQAALTRLKLAGRSQWPPLVKVLLETPFGNSSDEALRALTDFAAKVRDETASL